MEVGVEVRCVRVCDGGGDEMGVEVGCVRLGGGGGCEGEVCETRWWRLV